MNRRLKFTDDRNARAKPHPTPNFAANATSCSISFSAGMRVLECLQLRVKDIEFERNEITVRRGKGAKDRVTTAKVT